MASKIVVAHNHPNGDVTPSNLDLALTLKLREACKSICIELIEHMIISEEKYYSLREHNLLI